MDIVSRHRAGGPIKAIPRELDLSRNTVRATLRRCGPPHHYRRPPAASELDPFRDYLLGRLAEFPALSAAAPLEEIRALGYEGGISILKESTYPFRQLRLRCCLVIAEARRT